MVSRKMDSERLGKIVAAFRRHYPGMECFVEGMAYIATSYGTARRAIMTKAQAQHRGFLFRAAKVQLITGVGAYVSLRDVFIAPYLRTASAFWAGTCIISRFLRISADALALAGCICRTSGRCCDIVPQRTDHACAAAVFLGA